MKITLISDKQSIDNSIKLAKALQRSNAEAEIILPIKNEDFVLHENAEGLGSFSMSMPFGNVKIKIQRAFREGISCIAISSFVFTGEKDRIYDEAEEISVFCHSIPEVIKYLECYPDYIFTISCKGALVPVILKRKYRNHHELSQIKTLHYINDTKYGIYNRSYAESVFGIDKEARHLVLSSNEVNLTKGAILCCSRIYVGERGISILYDRNSAVHHAAVQFGFKIRKLNMGIDYSDYDPEGDRSIHRNFTPELTLNRKYNKLMLQRYLRLKQDETIPLVAVYPCKSREIIASLVKNLAKRNIQLLILCKPNESYRSFIPSVYMETTREINIDDIKLRRIFSGTDLAIFPEVSSDYGNLAYISAAYGCVPVTASQKYFDLGISYFNKITYEGNGFTYDKEMKEDLIYTLWDALGIYRHDQKTFNKLIQNCMKKDFSVDLCAKQLINDTEKSPYFNF